MDIRVKRVETEADLDAVAATGYDVYGTEMGLHEFVDHDRHRLVFDPSHLATRFAALVDGNVVGSLSLLEGRIGPLPDEFYDGLQMGRFAEVVDDRDMAVMTRLFVRREYRASGVPFELMLACLRHAVERRYLLGFLDCQPHLLNLYLGLGARPYAPTWDQPGLGMMVPLVFVPDRAHFEAIRSPLLGLLDGWFDSDVAARVRPLLAESPPVIAADTPQAWAWLHGLLTADDRPHALAGFSSDDIAEITARGHVLACSRGERVIIQGQGVRTVYVVLQGMLEVRRGDHLVAVVTEGDVIGETAFLLDMPRTSDVIALSDQVRLLALADGNLRDLIEARGTVAAQFLLNLSRVLAQRLAGG